MTVMNLLRAAGCVFVLVVVASGCTNDSSRGTVTGSVTLDGEPLAQGAIKFVPLGKTPGVVTGTEIKDGRYLLPAEIGAAVGKNRVEITAVRKTGKMAQNPLGPPGSQLEMETSAIAERFNVASTLELDVKAGQNQADFAVAGE